MNYPHLRKFVAYNIVPSRLWDSEAAITFFTNDLISLLPKEKWATVNLYNLIEEMSFIPGYCGGGAEGTIKRRLDEELEDEEVEKELRSALRKDGFAFKFVTLKCSNFESDCSSDDSD
jgi:hypothetical protein